MAEIHIDPLEKKWIYFIALFLLIAWGTILYYTFAKGIHPPSNVEVIDSARLHLPDGVGGGEFMENNIGVHVDDAGNIKVIIVAARYGFYPQHFTVPVDTPITFRLASFDVLHGVHIPDSNMNTMIVPGYVSEVHTRFTKTGEFPLICNEYCGRAHATMYGMIQIVPKEQFAASQARRKNLSHQSDDRHEEQRS
jgi:cytochrome c oxidase subunit 2